MRRHEIKPYVTFQFRKAMAHAVAWVIEVLKLTEFSNTEVTGEGMFLRIEGDEDGESRDVAPDTAGRLVDHEVIEFCHKCKVFHPADDVTWVGLMDRIQQLLN